MFYQARLDRSGCLRYIAGTDELCPRHKQRMWVCVTSAIGVFINYAIEHFTSSPPTYMLNLYEQFGHTGTSVPSLLACSISTKSHVLAYCQQNEILSEIFIMPRFRPAM